MSMTWQDLGTCRDLDHVDFFAPENEALAERACHNCPVRDICFSKAEENGWDGVWGGHRFSGGNYRPLEPYVAGPFPSEVGGVQLRLN
jgi:hypothetical protein